MIVQERLHGMWVLMYHTDGRFCGLPYYKETRRGFIFAGCAQRLAADAANRKLKLFP